MIIRKECRTIFENNVNYSQCPIRNCCGDLMDIDDAIYPHLKVLWALGYETLFSCSGHPGHETDRSMYIMFDLSKSNGNYLIKYVNEIPRAEIELTYFDKPRLNVTLWFNGYIEWLRSLEALYSCCLLLPRNDGCRDIYKKNISNILKMGKISYNNYDFSLKIKEKSIELLTGNGLTIYNKSSVNNSMFFDKLIEDMRTNKSIDIDLSDIYIAIGEENKNEIYKDN